ncbi:MAG TPA: hypothetical protein VHG51_08625 [Longimicrobiaceae bacterium]|nr:hypothetical protein [Longimicrobiaceae bacterium]
MNKLLAAFGLAAVALFMLLGFFSSGAVSGAPATLAALALTVGLPAAGAGLLVRSHYAERARLGGRRAQLRQQTVDAEILRLAAERGGRLTAVEVATELAITPEAAKEALDGLAVRGQAEIEVTDAGLLVYGFWDVRHLGGKSSAKGVLDA